MLCYTGLVPWQHQQQPGQHGSLAHKSPYMRLKTALPFIPDQVAAVAKISWASRLLDCDIFNCYANLFPLCHQYLRVILASQSGSEQNAFT